MVIHPVADMDAAVRFYAEALGLELKFRDGERFCAFDAGGTTIALAAADEAPARSPSVCYAVDDVPRAVAALRAAGARVLRESEEGPHELRAVLEDPSGNAFVVYAKRT